MGDPVLARGPSATLPVLRLNEGLGCTRAFSAVGLSHFRSHNFRGKCANLLTELPVKISRFCINDNIRFTERPG